MHDYVHSVFLGIIEGLTEFLPVSSTAHLRIAQHLMGISLEDPYWKMYAIVIQLGAILSVLIYFRARIVEFVKTFPRGRDGDRTIFTHPLSLVLLAFVVTAGPCYLMDKKIGNNLESETVIGLALLIGGIVMWVVDVWAGGREERARERTGAPQLRQGESPMPAPVEAPTDFEAAPAKLSYEGASDHSSITWRIDDVKPTQAFVIGAAQILSATFPGTSRSMSTIAAGQVMRLSRPAALEFSFFLSIPVMVAATGLKLAQAALKAHKHEQTFPMDAHNLITLAIGLIVSFIVALACIHWFMGWVRNRGFVAFAVYRIVVGAALLTWVMMR